MSPAAAHRAAVPGGSLYYTTRGTGPALLIMGGGPSNADTVEPLAAELAADFTVVTYDRRGYSRSKPEDPAGPGPDRIARHADDAARLIAALSAGPAAVFGSSFGAVIALELAASAPAAVGRIVVHEPPLGQLLVGDEQSAFDVDLDGDDAGTALNAIAASVGVRRGSGPAGRGAGPAPADVEVFIRRDAPAIGGYRLDLGRLGPVSGRLSVAASEDSQGFYPCECARQLAAGLGLPLAWLPGNHAGMIARPAEFAAGLRDLLRPPSAVAGGPDSQEVSR